MVSRSSIDDTTVSPQTTLCAGIGGRCINDAPGGREKDVLCSSIEPPHRFEHFRSSRVRGIELVRGFHRGPPTRWQFWPMVQIASLESGSARLWAHGRSAVMSAGDTVVS